MDKIITDKTLTNHRHLFSEAKRYIPGGVNSPVRSFKAVGGCPVFIKRAEGSYLIDEEENKYLDYCLSWGVLILGHANFSVINSLKRKAEKGTSFGTVTKEEVELAKMIVEAVPSIEQVRLTNSGTEAVMGAVRLARAFTNRNKIIKFSGSYHGHADYFLIKSGSGQASFKVPSSSGVPKEFIKHTIVVPYNNIKRLETVMKENQRDLAGVIVEPVMANCGVILPQEGFLEKIRELCYKYKSLLIFDEVITGFRISYGGAQELFRIKPDLTCLGKIIGGGMPVGAFGGKRKIMKLLAPEGKVYQAGTLSGNPLSVCCGINTLKILKEKNPYESLRKKTSKLCEGIKIIAKKHKLKVKVNYIGSLFSVFFTDREVNNYQKAQLQDAKLFKRFFHNLLNKGIYICPSPFEANFLSTSHTTRDIEFTLKKIDEIFKNSRLFKED
jgi:glutamate-1-semialdehyde 2,1-aminomutase